ncbi:MAG: hypothetical protein WAW41_14560 [Methylobacter sp.]
MVASITKHKSGFLAQVYVKGVRDSSIFRTKREVEAWSAAREAELRSTAATVPGDKHTLMLFFDLLGCQRRAEIPIILSRTSRNQKG